MLMLAPMMKSRAGHQLNLFLFFKTLNFRTNLLCGFFFVVVVFCLFVCLFCEKEYSARTKNSIGLSSYSRSLNSVMPSPIKKEKSSLQSSDII